MDQLPFPAFYVEGYRPFRQFAVERLARVNLVVGRNGAGKSSLLEAFSLWMSSFDGAERLIERLRFVLESRDELAFDGLDDLAWGRIYHHGIEQIRIGLSREPSDLDLRIGRGPNSGRNLLTVRERVDNFGSRRSGIPGWLRRHVYDGAVRGSEVYPAMWDQIVLQNLQEHLLRAVRLVVPDVSTLAYVGKDPRVPVVTRAGRRTAEPLRSFGEGTYHLLRLALAATVSQGQLLTLDEIEDGLHHSIHIDVWRYLFAVAKELDVQIVATTHSRDMLEAFSKAANEHPEEGLVIKLVREGGDIRPVVFDEREMAIAVRQDIELR